MMRNWIDNDPKICSRFLQVNGGGKFCERLANLCALTDYNYESQTTCSLYRQLSSGFGHSIYYDEGRNEYLINSAKINIFKDQVGLNVLSFPP